LTRVLLVAPIPALRLGLRHLLAGSQIEVIGETDRLDTPELGEAVPDVVIYASASTPASMLVMDGSSPPAVLFLSDEPPSLQSMIRPAGAWGSLPLESSREELLAAIHALAEGLVVGSVQFFQARPAAHQESGAPLLSDREMEVLGLLAQGLSNKQIAAALGITEHTVKFHVSSIYTKLDVTNRAEAVRQGVRQGLIAI
jgi:DNA-binding NarL/FixJ family response regulator